MNKNDLEMMITNDFESDAGLINISADDILRIRKDSDFIDGIRKVCASEDKNSALQSVIDEICHAHPGARMTNLALKLLYDDDTEIKMDDIASLGDVLENYQNVDIVWGLGRNEKSQDGMITVCVICGFRNNPS